MARTKNKMPVAIGGWNVCRALGKGGNGQVYLVKKGDAVGALKQLSPTVNRPERIARFHDEVQAMRACADIPGVLPILDADLDPPPGQRPWFVMDLAEPLEKALSSEPSLPRVVEAVRDIAVVLRNMHARGYSHRDIKPDNLFFTRSGWAVGDFGLVSFEGKKAETALGERIGPIYFMAPEMLNSAVAADGRPADVHSLAKTLWVLATGQRFPLPGAYDISHEAFRIGAYIKAERTHALDQLVASATSFSPPSRPTMSQVVAELTAWLQPPPRQPSPLELDLRGYVLDLVRHRAANAAERGRQQRQIERGDEVGRRLRESFRPFAEEIQAALVAEDVFESVHLEIDNFQWGFNLVASIPGPGRIAATVSLQISISAIADDRVQVSASIGIEIRTAAPFKVSYWDKVVVFLEAGSEEAILLEQLREGIRKEFGPAVTRALEMALTPQNAGGHTRPYRFEVLDPEGLPVGNADILIVGGDGAYLRGRTGLDGTASLGPAALTEEIVLVSHSRHRGQHFELPLPQTDFRVTMEPSSTGGSMVCTSQWTQVDGLLGQVSLVHDSSDRTYMYGPTVAIDGGKTQPVPIALAKQTLLRGTDGAAVIITPRAFRGQCFLLDIEAMGGGGAPTEPQATQST